MVDAARPGAPLAELEQVASGWAIAQVGQDHARKVIEERGEWVVLDQAAGDPSQITTILVAEAAQEGDPESESILARAHAAIAFALVQAIALIAPRRIVDRGGVSLIGETEWFDPIRRLVEQEVFPPFAAASRSFRPPWARKSSSMGLSR